MAALLDANHCSRVNHVRRSIKALVVLAGQALERVNRCCSVACTLGCDLTRARLALMLELFHCGFALLAKLLHGRFATVTHALLAVLALLLFALLLARARAVWMNRSWAPA